MFVLQVFKISISLSQADRNINNTERLLTRYEGIMSSVRPEKKNSFVIGSSIKRFSLDKNTSDRKHLLDC